MNKTAIYEFVTSLLDGLEMEQTLFDNFLDIAQMYWENMRPWEFLRTEQGSQTVTPSGTFLTAKTLPADFRKWYARSPIVLTDSNHNVQMACREVPLQMKFAYQNDPSKFYTNQGSNSFFICGTFAQTLTINAYYIRKCELISDADDNEWEFPTEYHKILGLSVAAYYKLGVDYDLVNNSQGNNNAALALGIYEQMSEWDTDMQNSAVQGPDYGAGRSWTANPNGGNMGGIDEGFLN